MKVDVLSNEVFFLKSESFHHNSLILLRSVGLRRWCCCHSVVVLLPGHKIVVELSLRPLVELVLAEDVIEVLAHDQLLLLESRGLALGLHLLQECLHELSVLLGEVCLLFSSLFLVEWASESSLSWSNEKFGLHGCCKSKGSFGKHFSIKILQ